MVVGAKSCGNEISRRTSVIAARKAAATLSLLARQPLLLVNHFTRSTRSTRLPRQQNTIPDNHHTSHHHNLHISQSHETHNVLVDSRQKWHWTILTCFQLQHTDMAVATPLPATADRAGHKEEDSWLVLSKVLKAAQVVIRYGTRRSQTLINS